jgi:hypothetical protein
MAYQDISSRERLFTARNSQMEKQFSQTSGAAADAFNCWWYKTVAQHTAVVAQASTIMSEHRRIGLAGSTSAGSTSNGHAH